MATATAAPEIDGESLNREALALESDIRGIREKVVVEQRTLANLTDEREKLIKQGSQAKERPAAKAAEIAALISFSENAIAGLNAQIRPKENRLDEIRVQQRQLREAGQRAAEIGEVRKLASDAEGILIRAASVIQTTLKRDLDSYFAMRQKLDQFARRAQATQYPIPAPALAAQEARRRLDKLMLEKVSPILQLIGR